MSKHPVVEVENRTETGTNASRRLRAAGQVPANVYGLDLSAFSITVPSRTIEDILNLETGRNTILNLKLAGERQQQRAVMIREIQRDPLSERMVHVDFIRVDLTKKVAVQVPIRLLGVPEGVKNEGGLIDFVHRDVDVECLPTAIPEHLDVDVSALHIGQHVSVSDLSPPDGVTLTEPPETIIMVVTHPRVEAEPEPEAVAEGEEAAATEEGAPAEAAEAAEEASES